MDEICTELQLPEHQVYKALGRFGELQVVSR